jgi:hypothetical protein
VETKETPQGEKRVGDGGIARERLRGGKKREI